MNPPRFWSVLWPTALWMLLAFVLILLMVRGRTATVLIFSSMPLIGLLEAVLFRPLFNLIASPLRLQAAMWLMIVVSYLQWTALASGLAYVWRVWNYRRALAKFRAKPPATRSD
ncbi:MAG TPA: hypothetical protein ENO09_01015 [bacterium]|nr:hypothetical protein [bacterium]